MIKTILILLFYLIAPAIVLRLCARFPILNKLGAVLVCYVIGFIVGQIEFVRSETALLDLLSSASILLALPLLLFQINIRSWKSLARGAIISMCCAFFALLVTLIGSYFIFKPMLHESWKIGGLLVGLYTGGTPNLASIQQALQVSRESYLAVHTIDVLLGAGYMLFMISFAHKLISKILPRFKKSKTLVEEEVESVKALSLGSWLKAPNYKSIALSIVVAILIAAISAGIGFLINIPAMQMAVIILLITTLSLAASFLPAIKKLSKSYDTGMYIILIFSIAVASMADLQKMINISGSLAAYIAMVMCGTFVLHLLLCKLFRIDTDTMMVTSAALICSPPFVPVVSGAIHNREVMLSGITVGIIGYCVGNYLGIALAYMLKYIG